MKTKAKSAVKQVPKCFDLAPEVEELANKLIAKHHSHLASCKLVYLFVNKKMKSKGVEVAATAKKVAGDYQALTGFHFLITVSYPVWQELDDSIRLAVVDHELEHCFVEDDDDGNPKYSILPHDVEEFGSVILRRGLYTTNLIKIGTVMAEALEGISKDVVVKKLGEPDEDPVEAATKKASSGKKKSLKVKKSKDGEGEIEEDFFDEEEEEDAA